MQLGRKEKTNLSFETRWNQCCVHLWYLRLQHEASSSDLETFFSFFRDIKMLCIHASIQNYCSWGTRDPCSWKTMEHLFWLILIQWTRDVAVKWSDTEAGEQRDSVKGHVGGRGGVGPSYSNVTTKSRNSTNWVLVPLLSRSFSFCFLSLWDRWACAQTGQWGLLSCDLSVYYHQRNSDYFPEWLYQLVW